MRLLPLSIMFALLVTLSASAAEDQYRAKSLAALAKLETTPAVPFTRTAHPDAQWFPDASFGLFMHWGIHSAAGIQPSWAMMEGYPYGTDRREFWGKGYYSLLTKFNPDRYDPDLWIKAARDAGMTYAVLTVKHHDGYALWPSEYGDLGTKRYMNGRDLIGPYIEACRKYGLKAGLYFSPRDWGYPGYPVSLVYGKPYVNPRTPEQNRADYEKFYAYTVGQLSEILTRWGKIDLLWFDGMGWEGVNDLRTDRTLAWVRALQPGIVLNDRWDSRAGDYRTPEVEMPESAPDGWWENCVIWSGHWGYSPDMVIERNEWVFDKLVTIRSWGGNLLLNLGPAPDGTMRPGYYERTAELAAWMAHSRASLIGAGPLRNWKDYSTVPVTRKDATWYLHVLPKHRGAVELFAVPEPADVKLLRDGTKLKYTYEGRRISVAFPKELRKGLDDVVAVIWSEAPMK